MYTFQGFLQRTSTIFTTCEAAPLINLDSDDETEDPQMTAVMPTPAQHQTASEQPAAPDSLSSKPAPSVPTAAEVELEELKRKHAELLDLLKREASMQSSGGTPFVSDGTPRPVRRLFTPDSQSVLLSPSPSTTAEIAKPAGPGTAVPKDPATHVEPAGSQCSKRPPDEWALKESEMEIEKVYNLDDEDWDKHCVF